MSRRKMLFGLFLVVMLIVTLGVAVLPGMACDGNDDGDDDGYQGCQPSFWRREKNWQLWQWEGGGYGQDDLYKEIFPFGPFDTAGPPGRRPTPQLTLLAALQASGGPEEGMWRHSVAAILNAGHPDVNYYYSEDEIKAIVEQAYEEGTKKAFSKARKLLQRQNRLACPLKGKGGDD